MSHCSPTTGSAGLSIELGSRGDSYDSLKPECDPVPALIDPPVRKSHHSKRPEGHIPRSPNAFILYRSDFLRRKVIPPEVESKQYNISTVVAECWRSLTDEEQAVWKDLAKEKEKEHARTYPDYKYKPQKREPVKKRRRVIPREQEIDHCKTLRATYLPGTKGSVVRPPMVTPPRKRKSRAKVRAAPKGRPVVESPTSVSPPSFDAHAFTDPLHHPSPQIQALDSAWQKQSQEAAWTSRAVLDPDLEPMIYFDFPESLSPDNEMEADDSWYQNPVLQSTLPESMPTHEPVLLNAASHIRQKYDIARRGATFPTPSMDSLEAQAIFERQPFFAPSTSTDAAYPATPEAYDNISSPGNIFPNFTFPQFDYSPSPSYHASTTPAGQSDTPLSSGPQHFPMSLVVSSTMDPLRLQPPTFGTHNLDLLTVSLDFPKLDKLEGVDCPLSLFGEIDGLGLRSGPGLGMMMSDLLNVDVCSREE